MSLFLWGWQFLASLRGLQQSGSFEESLKRLFENAIKNPFGLTQLYLNMSENISQLAHYLEG